MAQRSASPLGGSSVVEREGSHDDDLMNVHRFGDTSKEVKKIAPRLNNPIQVEQDSRVAKAKADAAAARAGPDKPEVGLNQDD